ncbi:MAG TPA: chemotaxis protein CheW [Candidatus Aquilonibacter sp.]|nr:chemotaxis protein CheW [Candidatus Aquilonibacter sp.]
MSDADIVKDFLVESYENLDRLDRELVGLEKHPEDRDALASVFRTIHTIKGNCGFLGFSKLEKVAHVGESLLTLLRDGKLLLSPEITTALLSMVDAVRQMLSQIGSTGQDGDAEYPELIETLTRLQSRASGAAKSAPPKAAAPAAGPAPAVPLGQAVPPPPVEAPPAPRPTPLKPPVAIEATANAHPSEAPAAGESRGRDAAPETIRVGVNLLDKLMTLVGELVLARNQLLQFSNTLEDANLQTVSQRMNLIATELQEEVMKTRMQPIGNIWNQFPRTVRDVALGCGKEVSIEMEGKETELDKTIIEAIKDPLTHLVRNAVDHGIELPEVRVQSGKPRAGRLILRAFHEGGQVNIEISDDGAGLNVHRIRQKAVERGLITSDQSARMPDREIFNLIFLPGFSTAEKVTNVSGRGVGMDVVKTNVEKIGGTVDIQSTAGQGTTVRVKIPLTLAIIPALIVTCAGDRYAIPQVSLVELVRLEAEQAGAGIELVHGAPVYRLRGRLLPLVYLARELRVDGSAGKATDQAINIVVLQADARQFGLVVDAINDTEEIVVKPLRKQLKSIKTFAGASIMGDGKIALILDVMGVAQRAGVVGETRDRALEEAIAASAVTTAKEKQTFLLFHGPDQARMAVPLDTLARLEEMPHSQVERAGTQLVAQYRGRILPLVRLAALVEERRERRRYKAPDQTAPLQVLVCNHEGHRVGLVVERIVDIVEDTAEVKYPASRKGIQCSAVIQDKVTELIDVPAILKAANVQFDLQHAEVSH